MARIIGGSMIGELSGKLGGNVFARNKAGAYIRQYVVPVNPNTAAQVNARNSFGSASSSYHSLTDLQKSQWQNFAQNIYLPKFGANTGQFSGFNAFTSLRNVVTNAQRLLADPFTLAINNLPVTPDSILNFEPVSTPPAQTIQANIAAAAGAPITLYLTNASLSTAGNITFNLNLGGSISPVGGNIDPNFTDGAGHQIGFGVYLSNPVQQENMFIANPEIIAAGYIPPIILDGPDAAAVTSLSYSFSVINPAEYQSFYNSGDYVRISVYSVSTNGQTIRIGSKTVQV